MIVGRNYFELKEEEGSREQFLHIKRYFDGRHSVNEISRLTGASEQSIIGIIDAFDEMGLLRQEEPDELIPVGKFIERVKDSCVMWSRQIGYHRLFGLLHEGRVRKEVFIGLVLETYHYVKSASKHISTALAHSSDDRLSKILAEYLTEEYDHDKLILESLKRMGMPEEHVIHAHPIIGTMSLINMLCEIGRQSTLAYFACTTLFESRQEDFDSAKNDLEYIGSLYGYGADVLEPIIQHLRADVSADHINLLEEALEKREFIAAADAHFAVNCLHDLKHSFDQFHDQVIQYYSDISNYIPRLKVDYFSL